MKLKITCILATLIVSLTLLDVNAETRRCPVCDPPNAGRIVSDVNGKPTTGVNGTSSSRLNSSSLSVNEIRNRQQIDKSRDVATGNATLETSNAARRESMRQAKIPTSQQPVSQGTTASGKHYNYNVPAEGGGTQKMSVQQQTLDRNHMEQPHWESGKVKSEGVTNQYNVPRLDSSKSKVKY